MRILAAIFCLLAVPCFAANHYIRAGASGAGNGSSWTDAWTTFGAASFTRGDTYYVAGGTYTEAVYINVATSGTTWIYIKKANTADNGSDPGWNASYATTVATINGTLDLDKGYVSVDGVTGSGTSGHGIRIYNASTADSAKAVLLEDVAGPFSLSHLEVQGSGFAAGAGGTAGIYSVNSHSTKNLYVGYCWIHEVTTNGVVFTNVNGTSYSDYGLLFENNVVSETGGCTDPDKHGQGMQLGYSAGFNYAIIRNNVYRNILGSGMIVFLAGGNNLTYSNLEIYNNVFYLTNTTTYNTLSPGAIWWEGSHNGTNTGMVLTNLLILNNAFYNITGGSNLAAVSLGSGSNETITNAVLKNSIYENCNFGTAPYQLTAQSNNGYYNNGGANVPSGTTNQVNGSATTFTSASTGNFNLVSGGYAVGVGLDLSAYFTTDAAGYTRSVPWDIGAYKRGFNITATSITVGTLNYTP